MMSFIHCFAGKSTNCHEIDPNPLRELIMKRKTFKFIIAEIAEFTRICNFEITKQKTAPPETLPGGEGNNPSPHPLFRRFVPPTLNSC